jgi:hypothetical protein
MKMISDPCKSRTSFLAIALNIAASIGGLEQNRLASAEIFTKVTVSDRAAAIRTLIGKGYYELDKSSKTVHPDQWTNWGNWQNWGNWPNWGKS